MIIKDSQLQQIGQAAKSGNLALIENFVNNQGNINLSIEGFSLGHIATLFNQELIVKYLIVKGIDIHTKEPEFGHSIGHLAVMNDSINNLQLWINAGGHLNDRSNTGNHLLHLAAKHQNLKIIQLLIEHKCDINACNQNEETALHWAIVHSNKLITKELIKAGADVNAKTHKGWTPLHYASHHNRPEIAIELIKAGADLNSQNFVSGRTPLHIATLLENSYQMIELLISFGANLNIRNIYDSTPLIITINDHYKIILLKHGADTDNNDPLLTPEILEARDFIKKFHSNPLAHQAISCNQIEEFNLSYQQWLGSREDNEENIINFRNLSQELYHHNIILSPGEKQAMQDKALSIAAAKHQRLGKSSLIKDFPIEILEKIAKEAFGNTHYSAELDNFETTTTHNVY